MESPIETTSYTEEELNSMTIANLKEILDNMNVSYNGIYLKADYVQLVLDNQ